MSRAFVKEPEGNQADADLPERPQSGNPNYITLRGLSRLQENYRALLSELESLQPRSDDVSVTNRIKTLEAETRYLKKRLDSAIPVDIGQQSRDAIHFGAAVTLADEDDEHYTFTIVGEDEADPEQHWLSWVSPLPSAVLGKRTGDVIQWRRPDGEVEMEIIGYEYRHLKKR
ncbi:MAG: GreA/GreB family elongation factor [Gammaproteobacteria bacterium]|jgi:transcription elongation factor GreB